MKFILPGLFLSALGLVLLAADRPAAQFPPGGAATNGMLIFSDGGWAYSNSTSTTVYWKNVRAADAQMYLECERLVATFDTNVTRRLDVIIMETNLMILTRDMQIIGDRAVYTASNDVLVITGDWVAAVSGRNMIGGTNFVYDRRTGNLYNVGPTATHLDTTGFSTNANPVLNRPAGARATNPPPAKPGPGSTR